MAELLRFIPFEMRFLDGPKKQLSALRDLVDSIHRQMNQNKKRENNSLKMQMESEELEELFCRATNIDQRFVEKVQFDLFHLIREIS